MKINGISRTPKLQEIGGESRQCNNTGKVAYLVTNYIVMNVTDLKVNNLLSAKYLQHQNLL